MNIHILFPTATEAAFFNSNHATVHISGVGLSQTAYYTLKTIQTHRPDWIILAGSAGAFLGRNLHPGDVNLVAREIEADLGFFTATGFTHLKDLDLDMEFERPNFLNCPYVERFSHLNHVSSISVNAALAPFIDRTDQDIENMEGAAFFACCQKEGQAFLEVRSVSNYVSHENPAWNLELATRNLATSLTVLIDQLRS